MSNTLKTHFAANMQENMNNLKASIVRAEASHMIDDIDGLRKHYANVLAENGALLGEYQKRTKPINIEYVSCLTNFVLFVHIILEQ